MVAIQMIPDAMRGYARRLSAQAEMLPDPGRLEGYDGPRGSQYKAVTPVANVLEGAPRTFEFLRNELRDLLTECAVAFDEAAAILEGADDTALTQLTTLTTEVDAAVTADEEPPTRATPTRAATPATPVAAPSPTPDVDPAARRGSM